MTRSRFPMSTCTDTYEYFLGGKHRVCRLRCLWCKEPTHLPNFLRLFFGACSLTSSRPRDVLSVSDSSFLGQKKGFISEPLNFRLVCRLLHYDIVNVVEVDFFDVVNFHTLNIDTILIESFFGHIVNKQLFFDWITLEKKLGLR